VLCSAIGAAEQLEDEVAGVHAGQPVPRFSATPPRRATTGEVRAMALYAGTSVEAVTGLQPAAEIVEELVGDID
jgi:hypothetical protein